TAGLDPKGREFILSEIKAYHESTGATVILVSHSMEDVARFASHVLIMNHSKVAMYGKTREIFKRVDELCEIGLEVPQISRVFAKLREKGYNVPESVLTVSEAKEAVLNLLKKGGEADA
ncbi:MAG: energy-coupling factor transporter ATPase, partial [Oscillospiraceae bacterium]|nr:energy-coupling factor transporter ATPase [Oscillospiraceae bacterium]